MLSKRFFDILPDASGLVAGKHLMALAYRNALPGKTLVAALARTSARREYLRRGCSHLALVTPVLCGQNEDAHSALN